MRKFDAIEAKINRVASLSGIKNPKKDVNFFKNQESKVRASKSLYRIKASIVSALANY